MIDVLYVTHATLNKLGLRDGIVFSILKLVYKTTPPGQMKKRHYPAIQKTYMFVTLRIDDIVSQLGGLLSRSSVERAIRSLKRRKVIWVLRLRDGIAVTFNDDVYQEFDLSDQDKFYVRMSVELRLTLQEAYLARRIIKMFLSKNRNIDAKYHYNRKYVRVTVSFVARMMGVNKGNALRMLQRIRSKGVVVTHPKYPQYLSPSSHALHLAGLGKFANFLRPEPLSFEKGGRNAR